MATSPVPAPAPEELVNPMKVDWDDFRTRMPQLIASDGVWEGWYRHYDGKTGALIDQHRSRLFCRIMPDAVEYPYHQTNHYYWENGKYEERDFPAWYADGRIWWDNEMMSGWCAPLQPDDFHRTSVLNWTRKYMPGVYFYELIHHADDGVNRARVWQWLENGVCIMRTLIDEKRVSHDWKSWTDNGPPRN